MFAYRFHNLCGSVHRGGNLLFTTPRDGKRESLLSPVGNRVAQFDLHENSSSTLSFENSKNITHVAVSPDGSVLLSIDEDGRAVLANFPRRVVLSRFNFKAKINQVAFSPNGKFFAVTHGHRIQIWRTPSLHKEFAPFVLFRTITGHHDDTTCIDWTADSRFIISGSLDVTARIHSIFPTPGFTPITLAAHRDAIIAVFFSTNGRRAYTISRDGYLVIWDWTVETSGASGAEEAESQEKDFKSSPDYSLMGRWKIGVKYAFRRSAQVTSAALHKASNLLVIGFSSGVFGIYDVQGDPFDAARAVINLQTLSISREPITSVSINSSGEWLAFGCAHLGQLLVWEWQSETYILKQQGHFYDMNCLAYSPNGQMIVTGDDYGKVKIWNTQTGFCFVTFDEHRAPITDATFSPQGHSVFTCSLDGTVRAFDLVRYRNFRTFIPQTEHPVQFSCMALDPSGEVICAASLDPFDIYLWSVQTGRLLDVLSGHEAPISSLVFSPTRPVLASASWDKTVRVWEIYASQAAPEVWTHNSDVLAVAFRPDGKEIATATLDGTLHFWDSASGTHVTSIEGRLDLMGGRSITDRRSAKGSAATKHFTSISYSADGRSILAGGNGKYVCIYGVQQRLLLKRYQVSFNRSLDGVLDMLNSKDMTAAGPIGLIDVDESGKSRKWSSLPGAQVGNLAQHASRTSMKRLRVKGVRFSPTGQSWAAVTTEGLLLYSLDETMVFDPFDLDIDLTPASIGDTMRQGQYLKALIMALRLSEAHVLSRIFYALPHDEIQSIVAAMPTSYVQRLLALISSTTLESPHIEFQLLWCLHCFNYHGRYLKANTSSLAGLLRNLQKSIAFHHTAVTKICDENTYLLDYLTAIPLSRMNTPRQANMEDRPVTPSNAEAQSTKKRKQQM